MSGHGGFADPSQPCLAHTMLGRLGEREHYQREMQRANQVMDRMRREDPVAWQEYLSELSSFEAGTSGDALPRSRV